ncbi:MAG: hypothetical protein J5965_24695, partial [Aeriscardovia sp.]|nr:hypothetical protein [Aeriscardovia sp.]
PNLEVKPGRGDGTSIGRSRESSTPPQYTFLGGVDRVNPPKKNTQKSLYFLISLFQFFFFIICI